MVGVSTDEYDSASARVQEFFEAGGEGFDFGWADERPGFWEEDEDEPVVGFGIRFESDFCMACQYGFSVERQCSSIPFNRPSTTAILLKSGAGCPTSTLLVSMEGKQTGSAS